MPRIENWSMISSVDLYMAPELRQFALSGEVYDHPQHENGKSVTTSPLVKLVDTDKIQTFSGSIYELGTVDPEYEKMYPNARQRLLDHLKKLTLDGR